MSSKNSQTRRSVLGAIASTGALVGGSSLVARGARADEAGSNTVDVDVRLYADSQDDPASTKRGPMGNARTARDAIQNGLDANLPMINFYTNIEGERVPNHVDHPDNHNNGQLSGFRNWVQSHDYDTTPTIHIWVVDELLGTKSYCDNEVTRDQDAYIYLNLTPKWNEPRSISDLQGYVNNHVRHEVLHAVMADYMCPADDDHSCGAVEWGLTGDRVSPMITGYHFDDSYPVDDSCTGHTHVRTQMSTTFTPSVTECTESAVQQHVDGELTEDSGGGGGGGCLIGCYSPFDADDDEENSDE